MVRANICIRKNRQACFSTHHRKGGEVSMIGTKDNLKVGDIVRAYDFAPRLGCPDCFIIGKVTAIEGSFFVADTLMRVWDGKVEHQNKLENHIKHSFRALCQGEMGFDKEYERVTILA
jgi:hypothetical protein